MTIYAKVHTYMDAAGVSQTCIAASADQADDTWGRYEVSDASRLFLDGAGNIAECTSDQVASNFANSLLPHYERSVQNWLDSVARMKGYDSALVCVSYLHSSNATYAKEAEAMIAWRDAVWAQCYAYLAAIKTGGIQIPADMHDLVAILPKPSEYDW